MSYTLLDSGHGRRLEQVGPYRLVRQAASAWWRPRLADWRADAVHHRADTGGGHWDFARALPERWEVELAGLRLWVKPTPFGHLGLFAEHAAQWAWMAAQLGRPARVLNLFAYTGGASIACARAGAEVTHVDAARGIVEWAQQNATLNGVDGIRWIVEDVPLFVARERRRGRRYDAVILDPPSFGRGARKELWKIEDHLGPLLEDLRAVLVPEPRFVLLSCHTPGYTGLALRNLVEDWVGPGPVEHGELFIPADRPLPSGSFARRGSATAG